MRSFDIKLLRAFAEVARTRSFTEAAVGLAISRPALSLQLIKLETQIGFPLLVRSTRRVTLTEEGTRLLPFAQRLVADNALLASEVQRMHEGSGALRVGVALHTSRWSTRNRLLDEFAERHPSIRLQVETGLQKNLLTALESGKIDAMLFGGLPTTRTDFDRRIAERQRSEGLFPDDLAQVVVDSIDLELLAPVESPLAQGGRIDAAAFRGQTIALPHPNNCPPLYGRFAAFVAEAGGTAEILSDHDAYSLDQYCHRRRLPVVWVGRLQAEPGNVSDIVSRTIEDIDLHCDLTLLSRPGDRTPALRVLIDFAHRLARERPVRTSIGNELQPIN
jgi:DNA-binding transcriptional LysR family regulator